MASQIRGPRKQRTRQHVIADLGVHHVEGFILEEGHTAQRFGSDYGYDLAMYTFDESGFVETGSVYFQVKASESLSTVEANFCFDLDVRDYNLWTEEDLPVILILFDVARNEACWLDVHGYFGADGSRGPTKGARTVRVYLPGQQILDRQSVRTIRGLKARYEKPKLSIQP